MSIINYQSLIDMSRMPTHLFADDIWSSDDIVVPLQVMTLLSNDFAKL
jgi:hypothetical protein